MNREKPVAPGPPPPPPEKPAQKPPSRKTEAEHRAPWFLAALSLHDCLMIVAGQALARGAVAGDPDYAEMADKITQLAQEAKAANLE